MWDPKPHYATEQQLRTLEQRIRHLEETQRDLEKTQQKLYDCIDHHLVWDKKHLAEDCLKIIEPKPSRNRGVYDVFPG